MPASKIDHITVTAPSLAAGITYVEKNLGVSPQAGGQHVRMGTHNALLHLGEKRFLEIIAIDPSASPPNRPRWFALDTLSVTGSPRLAAWVARCTDIRATLTAAHASIGEVEAMKRGRYDWLISIPQDGTLPFGGVSPMLIEWQQETHPADALEDHGLSLVALEIHHPAPDRVRQLLGELGIVDDISLHESPENQVPFLIANIMTPSGLRTLSSAES